MFLTSLLLTACLTAGETTGGAADAADFYQRTGHPQTATFYQRLAETRGAHRFADYYQRTGHPETAEFYRRLAARQQSNR